MMGVHIATQQAIEKAFFHDLHDVVIFHRPRPTKEEFLATHTFPVELASIVYGYLSKHESLFGVTRGDPVQMSTIFTLHASRALRKFIRSNPNYLASFETPDSDAEAPPAEQSSSEMDEQQQQELFLEAEDFSSAIDQPIIASSVKIDFSCIQDDADPCAPSLPSCAHVRCNNVDMYELLRLVMESHSERVPVERHDDDDVDLNGS